MNHGFSDKGSACAGVFGGFLETGKLHQPLRLPSIDAINTKSSSEPSNSKVGFSTKSSELSEKVLLSSKRRDKPQKKSKTDPELLALLSKEEPPFREIEISSKQSVSDVSLTDQESYHEDFESGSGVEKHKAILNFSELLAREVDAVPITATDSVVREGSKASELETLIASVGSAVSDIYENKSASQSFSLNLLISSVCSAITGAHNDQTISPFSGPEVRASSVGSTISSICDLDESTGRLDLPFELELKSSMQSNGLVQCACEKPLVFTIKPEQDDCATERPMPLNDCAFTCPIKGGCGSKSNEETMNIEKAIREDKSILILMAESESEPRKLTTQQQKNHEMADLKETVSVRSTDKVSMTPSDSEHTKRDCMGGESFSDVAINSVSLDLAETASKQPETASQEPVTQKKCVPCNDENVKLEIDSVGCKVWKRGGTVSNVSGGEVSTARFDDELSVEDLESILAYEDSEGFICLDDDPEGPELATYAAALSSSILSDKKFVFGGLGEQGHGSTTTESHAKLPIKQSFTQQLLSIASGDESESGNATEQQQHDRRKSEALELADDKYGPNRPHPALDYPLLYFFLRRCPWLFDRIKTAYAFRWRLSYPLQKRVPYSLALLKLGIFLTWGELLLILPFFAAIIAGILYTIVFPSVIVTGKIARFGLIGALVFAQRNSLVTLLLGIPFDRAIVYHKLSGRVGGIVGLLHTAAYFIDPVFGRKHQYDVLGGAFTGQVNISGSVLMLLIIGITLSSLPQIRRRLFEVFYYLHILFTTGMITCAFFHSGILVPILALLTWGADLFIRSIVMARTRYPCKAQLKTISETVVEISFPKSSAFAYNPGQYVYLAIPEISWLQWHPFSISSSPKQRIVTLHIRKAGNWTSALFDLAKTTSEVSILLEGPYGNVGVDIMGDRKYKNIMLISGGIGLTPMQSICDQLLYEKAKDKRMLNHLKFVWIERDPVLMQKSEFVKRTSSIGSVGSLDRDDFLSSVGSIHHDDIGSSEDIIECPMNLEKSQSDFNLEAQFHEQDHSIDIVSQLLALIPPGKTTDEELDKIYESEEFILGDDASEQKLHVLPTNESDATQPIPPKKRPSFVVQDETSFADNGSPWLVEAPPVVESLMKTLDMQVYLTGDSPTVGIPYARFGRPDIKKIFLEMKRRAIAAGDSRVAVCVCAPHALMDLCYKACIVYSDDNFRFDFHSEAMAL